MGTKMKKLKAREIKERLESQAIFVLKAMELGFTTRTDICESAGMQMYELVRLFKARKDVHAEFTMRRRTIVDMAVDNIEKIVGDREDPNNYAASKFIVTTYKSDLDDALEAKKPDVVDISVGGDSTASQVKITFQSKDKKE